MGLIFARGSGVHFSDTLTLGTVEGGGGQIRDQATSSIEKQVDTQVRESSLRIVISEVQKFQARHMRHLADPPPSYSD